MPQNRSVLATGLAAFAASVLLAGCAASAGAAPDQSRQDDRALVLTTFSVLADLADTVGGGHVRVESITKVGAEIHGYEPTPSDLVRAQEADLILDNGLGLERWFERFLNSVDAPHVVLSDGVEPVDIRSGDYTGRANPHAWMSPVAAQRYVDNTVSALSLLEPGHAADFEENGRALKAELDAILDDFRADIAGIDDPRKLAALWSKTMSVPIRSTMPAASCTLREPGKTRSSSRNGQPGTRTTRPLTAKRLAPRGVGTSATTSVRASMPSGRWAAP